MDFQGLLADIYIQHLYKRGGDGGEQVVSQAQMALVFEIAQFALRPGQNVKRTPFGPHRLSPRLGLDDEGRTFPRVASTSVVLLVARPSRSSFLKRFTV